MSAANALSVLIVDDDAVTRVDVQDYLAEAGFEVHEAASGAAGLERFERLRPDFVLLDVRMPGMDGFAVCERLRGSAAGLHTLIVMLTGLDDAESVERAYAAGATDFVTKPLNCPLLIHRLQYLLRAKHLSDELRASRESLAQAQRIARLGSWSLDVATRRFSHSTETGAIVFGEASAGERSLREVWRTLHPDDRAAAGALYRRPQPISRSDDIMLRIVHGDGEERAIRLNWEIQDDGQEVGSVLRGTLQDVTEQHRAQRRIRELAFFDSVTGLPNRVLLTEHLERAIERARRTKNPAALLFIDLDHFKLVNDSWGHEAGDTLLRHVAARFGGCLRRCDLVFEPCGGGDEGSAENTLARLGGDEFVILLSELRRAEDATLVAQRVLDALTHPFDIDGNELYVTASIGISIYPQDGEDAATLLKGADTAMYATKRESRNGFRMFTSAMHQRSRERLQIETRLRQALERDEFEIHYQPLVSARDGGPISMEALVRWNDPDRGLVGPGGFITVAEETGLIVPLGAQVLAKACRDILRLNESLDTALSVSVNLSAVQLRDPGLLRTVDDALESTGLASARLELELTESMLMGNTEESLALLHALRGRGVALSIDDFGTGYSSLRYMKRLPIGTLKIDRCFVTDIASDRDDAAIVRGTVQLAHSLGLTVVAEGVETDEQRDLLIACGCDKLQGYRFSKPLPFDDAVAWIARRRPHAPPGDPPR